MDNLFTPEEVMVMMERARKMRYIYKVLGASLIADGTLIAVFLSETFDGRRIWWPLVVVALGILLFYHISTARNWLKSEFGPYITEIGLIEKTEVVIRNENKIKETVDGG